MRMLTPHALFRDSSTLALGALTGMLWSPPLCRSREELSASLFFSGSATTAYRYIKRVTGEVQGLTSSYVNLQDEDDDAILCFPP